MDNRTVLFVLHETQGIGWKSIDNVVRYFPDLRDLEHADDATLQSLGIQGGKLCALRSNLNGTFLHNRLAVYDSLGVQIVTRFDEQYPDLLKHIANPPWVLYCTGAASVLNQPLVAMVGTRTPTVYGRTVAEQLAHALASNGFGIVSGMAEGIDSAAHRGALRGGAGKTIGVLGCGIDLIYPRGNSALYREVAEHGLLISEYPAGTPVHPGLFPLRNRIIAGISLGTVVVEAAVRSGSLITADRALDASRDVFAVPGPVTSPKSAGTLALIKQGAKLVSTADDIIEEYKHRIPIENNSCISPGKHTVLTEEENLVYGLLSAVPVTFDRILEESGLPLGLLHSVLLSLLMKNKIQQLPGSAYVAL